MNYNNNISIDNFESDLNDIVIKDNQSSSTIENEKIVSQSVVQDYLRMINRFPLLSEEESIKYSKNLKLINNLDIVKKGDKKLSNYDLDYSVILSCLTQNNYYDEIAKFLIKCLKNVNNTNDAKLVFIIKKYKNLCSFKGANLSSSDLKKYFNIKIDEVNQLKNKEFLNQIKQYFLYREARDKMINSNLRLVYNIAKNYTSAMEFIDLIQEGNIGLIKAVDNYDVDLGYKFSTFATACIKHRIFRAISKNKEHLKYNYTKISLNQPIFDDDDTKLEDTLQSDSNLDDEIIKIILKDEVNVMFNELESLTESEKNVIKMRFGFDNYRISTLKEIGEKLGISSVRVTMLERNALRKIRLYATSNEKVLSLRKYII